MLIWIFTILSNIYSVPIGPKVYRLDFNTAYNQFYVSDKGFKGNTASKDFWSEKAYNSRLAIDDGVLGVGIESYGHIKAELVILKTSNAIKDFSKFDHVVEGSIKINSGSLEITDCPNNDVELAIKIKPGNYRVRIYSIDLSKADPDLFAGKDSYKIELWPDKIAERKVLKQYHR